MVKRSCWIIGRSAFLSAFRLPGQQIRRPVFHLTARRGVFHPRGKAMPILLAPHHRLTRDPVELNDAARAGEWLVTMPRVIAAPKRQQRAFGRRHFENDVFQIRPGSQQSKLATGRFPSRSSCKQG